MNSSASNNSGLYQGPDYYKESLEVVIVRLSFETVIALAGLVGNILVCIVIASKRLRGRSSMHYYLMNLALADIGVLVIVFPLGVMKERIPNYWPFGKVVCLYVYPWVDTFYGASIWFITFIAFQRYQNIVKAKDFHSYTSPRHVFLSLLGIWTVSFMIVSLPLFFVYQYYEVPGGKYCQENWKKAPDPSIRTIYTVSLVFFSYVLPLGVIFWTYVGIWREIRKSTQFHKTLDRETGSSKTNKTRGKRLSENSRARKILTPIVVTFAVSMLPVNVFRLLALFWQPVFFLRHFWTLYNAIVIITTANSAVNPIIYSVVSRDFRKAFIQLIFRCRDAAVNGTLYSKSEHVTKVTNFQHRNKFSTKNWPDAEHLKETMI